MKSRTIILVVLFGLALGVLACGPLVELVSRVADVAGVEEGEVMDEPLVEQPAESEGLPAFEPDDRRQTVLVQTIEAGQTVEAAFEGAWDAHNWVFEGRAGQEVTFTTGLPEGAGTDPILTLLDPQGAVLATADDVNGYNAELSYVLPADGLYTARVTTWWPGPYTLTFISS